MKAFSALATFLSTHPWVTLVVAIASEVMATSALKAADGFRHWLPLPRQRLSRLVEGAEAW